jgi:murein DD-endopeptidase MepM/ murein hydrolase activator NlpD
MRGTWETAPAGGAVAGGRSAPRIIAAAAPALARPVAGAITGPYGVARDEATGAWFFRTAVSFVARPTELVRCPVGGRVMRFDLSLAGGEAIVVEADAHGWTIIISGLAEVSVTPGQPVGKGESVGRAEAQRPATVRLETWRGHTPVDPAALLGRG